MFFGSFIICWSSRASGVSFVFPYTPRNPSRFTQRFFVTCITSIEERTRRTFQYGSSQNIDFFFHMGAGEGSTHQCPLLWTWVLEKMGMLEIVERLTDKQPGDTRFTQVQAPRGKTLLLLVCS